MKLLHVSGICSCLGFGRPSLSRDVPVSKDSVRCWCPPQPEGLPPPLTAFCHMPGRSVFYWGPGLLFIPFRFYVLLTFWAVRHYLESTPSQFGVVPPTHLPHQKATDLKWLFLKVPVSHSLFQSPHLAEWSLMAPLFCPPLDPGPSRTSTPVHSPLLSLIKSPL